MKKHLSTFLLIAVLLIGLSLLLYPTVSDYWNSLHQSRAITSYAEQVSNLDEDEYETIWAEANQYNLSLLSRSNSYTLTEQQEKEYDRLTAIRTSGPNPLLYSSCATGKNTEKQHLRMKIENIGV